MLSLIDLQQVDQLLLFQHGLMNRTRMRLQDCVAKEASGLVTTSSIFNCFSSHNYPAASYLHKSLHASKACPFNTNHHACSFTAQLKPQDYDCLCDTLVTRICTLIHLSQRDGDIRSTAIDPFIRDSPLELPQIIKSEAYVKNYVVPLTLT